DEGQLPPRRRLREPRDERREAAERDLDPRPEEGGLPLLVRRQHQEEGCLQGGVDHSLHTNNTRPTSRPPNASPAAQTNGFGRFGGRIRSALVVPARRSHGPGFVEVLDGRGLTPLRRTFDLLEGIRQEAGKPRARLLQDRTLACQLSDEPCALVAG